MLFIHELHYILGIHNAELKNCIITGIQKQGLHTKLLTKIVRRKT